MPPRFEHIEFTKPPLRLGHTDAKEEKKKETCVAILEVTKEQVEGLRKKANEIPCQDVEMVSTRPYSRYEAIASHLSVSPPGYFGNTVLQTITSKCIHGDLLAKPLSYAAGKLREAIERMTDEYIRSALDFIASQKDVGALRCGLHNGAHTNPPNYLGNPNASIISWINLPFYGMDYGWGKPIYVGPALLNDDDGKTYIMSSPAADGSLIIALRLQTECMNSFKKFFYEDMP
ncbi:spermidine hydroxycinnamoyl transferase-like [Juglans microcarpa x Juglans regia]|uniref:spermidine hydroxycinnamoyl transferase-like n=1 Tax=Juglans microcarpa x Juglans regia TaxID=2249226 RepID=UPI001B7E160D|nr:spermidine hydroxycinnamoyl transferase-like [Juglans microcarpa x Juglans regia]